LSSFRGGLVRPAVPAARKPVRPVRQGQQLADPKLDYRSDHLSLVAKNALPINVRQGQHVATHVTAPDQVSGAVKQGQVLGQHDGIEFYTIGQRKGLGISSPKPLYVVELEPESNRVVVGDETALDRGEFQADRCNWIPFEQPPARMEVMAKIRYNHPGTAATVTPLAGEKVHVRLHSPQRAITPGQAAVFYQDDLVLGGGWIC